MHKISQFLLILSLAACNSSDENSAKEVALPPSKHSDTFNHSVQVAMQNYYHLTEAFVNWDSVSLTSVASELTISLNNLALSELKGDSSVFASYIVAAHTDLNAIRNNDLSIATKRLALNALTDHLYGFLKTAQYDRQKLYLQKCPMAFNDEEPGVWLSEADSIRNPYLGLHHPRYGKGMLECGETKDVVNFTGVK